MRRPFLPCCLGQASLGDREGPSVPITKMMLGTRTTHVSLALALSLSAACAPTYAVSNDVRLRDPARTSLRTKRDKSSTVLSEGKSGEVVPIADGWLLVRAGVRTRAQVNAVRTQNGQLQFEGYWYPLVYADGSVAKLPERFSSESSLREHPSTGPEPDALFPLCCCSNAGASHQIPQGDLYACRSDVLFSGYLATPWDNVVEIRREKHVGRTRWLALIAAISFAAPTIAGGGVMIGEGAGRGGGPGLVAGGSLLAALGGTLFGVVFAPTVFARDSSETIYPPPERRYWGTASTP